MYYIIWIYSKRDLRDAKIQYDMMEITAVTP